MVKVRAYLDDTQVGQTFSRAIGRYPDRIRWAARTAVADIAQAIEEKGRANIAAAGHFGSRWTQGFTATVTEGGGNIRINVEETAPHWTVFEFGADIKARNPSGLLWIPLSFAGVPEGLWPKDYPGRLFRVDRKRTEMRWRGRSSMGPRSEPMLRVTHSMSDVAPLLFSVDDRKPKYFGKPSVTIPRKFALRDIVREELRQLPLLFRVHTKGIRQMGG